MMKQLSALILLATLIVSCTSAEQKAQDILDETRKAVSEHRYDDARSLVDSLRSTYPTAVEARREAIVLENEFELADARRTLLTTLEDYGQEQARLDSLKPYFVLEKDAKYQAVGYYVNPEQIGSRMHKTALRAQVSEEGQMVLISICHGKRLGHKRISVSLPTGESAQTPQCISFLKHDVIGYEEEATYRLGEDGGVIEFITKNSGTMTVTCIGETEQKSFQLSPSDKFAVRHCYILAQQFAKVKTLSEAVEKLRLKVRFYEKKLENI